MELKTLISQVPPNPEWVDEYEKWVPRFIEEASKGHTSPDAWPEGLFEEYVTSGRNCISRLGQGVFIGEEIQKLKSRWGELAPLLQQVARQQDRLDVELYDRIEQQFFAIVGTRRLLAVRRMIVGLQPQLLGTLIARNSWSAMVTLLHALTDYRVDTSQNWYQQNNALHRQILQSQPVDGSLLGAGTLMWRLLDYMRSMVAKGLEKALAKRESRLEVRKWGDGFVWVGTQDGVIGHSGCHYEVCYDAEKMAGHRPGQGYVEVHFEGDDAHCYASAVEAMAQEGLAKTFRWSAECKGLRLEEQGVTLSEEGFCERLAEQLIALDEALGKRLRQAIETIKNKREDMEKLKDYVAHLKRCKNLVLTGAPGSGKSHLALEMARLLVGEGADVKHQIKMVQFHPSMDYTDFVEGLRPVLESGGSQLGFERRDGIFKHFCGEAAAHPDRDYVLIIDEINRGEMSKIFGELFFAIDPGYRGEQHRIDTQYQRLVGDDSPFKEGFYIPERLYIIGTMNDIDRSVESIDLAIRRRFEWREVMADERAEAMGLDAEAIRRMRALNDQLTEEGFSSAYHIGAAYFREVVCWDSLWRYRLRGLLYEYMRGDDAQEVEERLKRLEEAYYSTTQTN